MAVTLNASTTTGLVQTADTSGTIELQNNGTTRLTVNSSGATIPTATITTGTVTTLNTPTGVLATQNGMTGIAKAWVNFTGSATPTIVGSFNVSSITYNTTGDYTINFTTAMSNANYVITTMAEESRILTRKFSTAPTTIAFRLVNQICTNAATADASYAFCAVHGS
jgi:hypothetical protein